MILLLILSRGKPGGVIAVARKPNKLPEILSYPAARILLSCGQLSQGKRRDLPLGAGKPSGGVSGWSSPRIRLGSGPTVPDLSHRTQACDSTLRAV